MSNLAGNTFSDFPADRFDILASCNACGHQASVDRDCFPEGLIVVVCRGIWDTHPAVIGTDNPRKTLEI